MKKWHKETVKTMDDSWKTYFAGLCRSLDQLEKDINEAENMQDTCTGEWCQATEHVLDELANALYTIHEPTFSTDAEKEKIKKYKKKVHDLYAKFKQTSAGHGH